MPHVSVLIPAFNASVFIAETLLSVMTQSADVEVIVVDDGSSDETMAIAQSFEPRVRVLRASGKGAQAARNQALNAAVGKYVKFLDADDILLPGVLTHQIRMAEKLPENHIVYGPAISMSEDGILGDVIPHFPRPKNMDHIAHILYYSPLTSCPLHRRDLLVKVGGMDEGLSREHENDLHIRLALSGVEFVYDKNPVYAYRQHNIHFSLMKGGVTRFGEKWMLEYLRNLETRLNTHYKSKIPFEVAKYLGLFYWKTGRSLLRESALLVAQECFADAMRLCNNCVCGSKVYRVMVCVMGPYRSEWLLGKFRLVLTIFRLNQS